MTPEKWRKLEQLYTMLPSHTDPRDRTAYVAEACGDDTELRRELESLLNEDSGSSRGFLGQHGTHLATSSAEIDLSPGTALGQYRILEHLGAGGMGTVYKATDTKLDRPVALKLLHPEMLSDAAGVARFEREARMLASLNHPHIATIYGFEDSEGVRFLALEYVPGVTLAERLRHGRLSLRETAVICKQIAEALEAAHSNAIIHRDLKPANIKVSESGQVKVLDFGLAKPMSRARPAVDTATRTVTEKLTRSMTILGTAEYMSPEQAIGNEVDSRADIWSFGCVMYEMLTGKQVFTGARFPKFWPPLWNASQTGRRCRWPPRRRYSHCRRDVSGRIRTIGCVTLATRA